MPNDAQGLAKVISETVSEHGKLRTAAILYMATNNIHPGDDMKAADALEHMVSFVNMLIGSVATVKKAAEGKHDA
jgi:hypothetical protein